MPREDTADLRDAPEQAALVLDLVGRLRLPVGAGDDHDAAVRPVRYPVRDAAHQQLGAVAHAGVGEHDQIRLALGSSAHDRGGGVIVRGVDLQLDQLGSEPLGCVGRPPDGLARRAARNEDARDHRAIVAASAGKVARIPADRDS